MADDKKDARNRRPMGFFGPFNKWWSNFFLEHGRRPSKQDIEGWRNQNPEWRPELRVEDIVQHSKGRRDPVKNRLYFVEYRRKLKAAAMKPSKKATKLRRTAPAPSSSSEGQDEEPCLSDGAEELSALCLPTAVDTAKDNLQEGTEQVPVEAEEHRGAGAAIRTELQPPHMMLDQYTAPFCRQRTGISAPTCSVPLQEVESCDGQRFSLEAAVDSVKTAAAPQSGSACIGPASPSEVPICVPTRRARGPRLLAMLREQNFLAMAHGAYAPQNTEPSLVSCSISRRCTAHAASAAPPVPAPPILDIAPADLQACTAFAGPAAVDVANLNSSGPMAVDALPPELQGIGGGSTAVSGEAFRAPLWLGNPHAWGVVAPLSADPSSWPGCWQQSSEANPQPAAVLTLQGFAAQGHIAGTVQLPDAAGLAADAVDAAAAQPCTGILLRSCSASSINGMSTRRGSQGVPRLPPLRLVGTAREPVPVAAVAGLKRAVPDSGSDSDWLPHAGAGSSSCSPAASAADAACSVVAVPAIGRSAKRHCYGSASDADVTPTEQCVQQAEQPASSGGGRATAPEIVSMSPCRPARVVDPLAAASCFGEDPFSLPLSYTDMEAELADPDWLETLLVDPGAQPEPKPVHGGVLNGAQPLQSDIFCVGDLVSEMVCADLFAGCFGPGVFRVEEWSAA